MSTTDEPTNRRARRLANRLERRFLQPDKEHPILRAILQQLLPVILNLLVTQLPIWLADADHPENDTPTA